MKTVHEFFPNARMDGAIFVHSWFHSRMVVLARVESLPLAAKRLGDFVRGRISAFEPRESTPAVIKLFCGGQKHVSKSEAGR